MSNWVNSMKLVEFYGQVKCRLCGSGEGYYLFSLNSRQLFGVNCEEHADIYRCKCGAFLISLNISGYSKFWTGKFLEDAIALAYYSLRDEVEEFYFDSTTNHDINMIRKLVKALKSLGLEVGYFFTLTQGRTEVHMTPSNGRIEFKILKPLFEYAPLNLPTRKNLEDLLCRPRYFQVNGIKITSFYISFISSVRKEQRCMFEVFLFALPTSIEIGDMIAFISQIL